jgi:hypothetical protein
VSRATAHRRFIEWTEVGLWPALHRAVLDRLNAASRLSCLGIYLDVLEPGTVRVGDSVTHSGGGTRT